jgi:hypothetical protein
MCFILDRNNRIKHCHIVSLIKEKAKDQPLYQVQDLVDWRYIVVEEKYCAIKKIELKGMKRKE